MRQLFLIALLCIGQPFIWGQTQAEEVAKEKAALPKPYNTEEDGLAKIEELLVECQKQNKKLLIQIGGNWCVWCLRFNHLVTTDLNYSPENKNEKAFAKYGNPGEKYGYPAFLILDKHGNLLATRKTEDMEESKGYDRIKVKKFLQGRLN